MQKAINLAKKTGDRLIVFESPVSESAYIVMSLNEYEKMSVSKNDIKGLTEDELLDKINRDIAIWKSEQDFINSNQSKIVSFEQELNSGFIDKQKDNRRKSAWAIPEDRKQAAEEIIEEDRQYLEEIKF